MFSVLCNGMNNNRYSLYHTDNVVGSSMVFDCFYIYNVEGHANEHKSYVMNYQLVPYCRRPYNDDDDDEDDEEQELFDISYENIAEKITFNKLREQGVTSEQLLNWSASIDLAERYEMNNRSSELFYNCSSPWFGWECQYRFAVNSSLSFTDIKNVLNNIHETIGRDNISNTCYPFVADCDRGPWPLCLDWRQICDGKADCINGKDEQWCETLEWTKCMDDQYRCHYGGQCIPSVFVLDNQYATDCLDGSEEIEVNRRDDPLLTTGCTMYDRFFCEDRINRYPLSFPCGDGTFIPYSSLPRSVISCENKRDRQVSLTMFTSLDHIKQTQCRQAFYCSLFSNRSLYFVMKDGSISSREGINNTWNQSCEFLGNSCSDKWIVLSAKPLMYGFFQLVYLTNRSTNEFEKNIAPDFVCFDAQKCPILLSDIIPMKILDGLTCCSIYDLVKTYDIHDFHTMNHLFSKIFERCSKTSNEMSCFNSSYFHCYKSRKCISYHRVGDGFYDCYYQEDESFLSCQLNETNRFECKSKPNKCLLPVAMGNKINDCSKGEDEVIENIHHIQQRIPLSAICNVVRDDDIVTTDKNETDETNCDWWPCYNPYVVCNGFWECLNGIDEMNCPKTNCSLNEFQCKNKYSNLTYCLPWHQMFHNRIDDCQQFQFIRKLYFDNRTDNMNEYYYSFNKTKCINQNDICPRHSNPVNIQKDTCSIMNAYDIGIDRDSEVHKMDDTDTDNNTYLCTIIHHTDFSYMRSHRFLIPLRLGYFPSVISSASNQKIPNTNQQIQKIPLIDSKLAWYCHRGVILLSNHINKTKKCLCPPNYFGSRCQWQSQRISLTIQLKLYNISLSTTIFQLIIMLIDEQGLIVPNYEQITYIPSYSCNTKFHLYLLYPDRPKNLLRHYSIRIDLFDKSIVNYWNSWYLSIPFQFLPVNRIATQLIIQRLQENQLSCSMPCGEHGRCMKYTNMNSSFFCRCNSGYSGTFCNITYECQCSKDSLCLTESICVCPLTKSGSYCYLKRSICQSINNPCQHNGTCIPFDDRINIQAFICVCQQDYYGERCQYKSNQIDIIIDETIIELNSTLSIHYVTSLGRSIKHQIITTFKKIAFGQNLITIYISQTFHILFIQMSNNDYYLTILRENFLSLEYIRTKVLPNQRCISVENLFNETFRQYEYLRRIKYYPYLCRQNTQLMCFYDEFNTCVCDSDRYSNCFEFNRTIEYNCDGRNLCGIGGRCLHNNNTCPTSYICVCYDCYYGDHCQFSTNDFILSLDPILGYHIKPNVLIQQQPFLVILSIVIITILFVLGIIMGSFSIAVFKKNECKTVGCGYYLLAASISSVCMTIVLKIKFWHLVLSQTSVLTNRPTLYINCILIEIILKVCLASSEWLTACVAIERTFGTLKGATFNKIKSKKLAKKIIFIVIIFTILTHIHDPVYRELIDDVDGDQQRTWCFAQYSSTVKKYNTFIILFHFLLPLSSNVISAILLVIIVARNRFKLKPEQPFTHHFHEQLQVHKHILIAPCLLILLSLPRLIISFFSGCMRSPHQSLLYLIAYFLSYIPSMLIFLVFVLPSKTYKSEFSKILQRWIRRFRQRF